MGEMYGAYKWGLLTTLPLTWTRPGARSSKGHPTIIPSLKNKPLAGGINVKEKKYRGFLETLPIFQHKNYGGGNSNSCSEFHLYLIGEDDSHFDVRA